MDLNQVDVIANQRTVSILPGCTKGHTLLLIRYPEGRDIGSHLFYKSILVRNFNFFPFLIFHL